MLYIFVCIKFRFSFHFIDKNETINYFETLERLKDRWDAASTIIGYIRK